MVIISLVAFDKRGRSPLGDRRVRPHIFDMPPLPLLEAEAARLRRQIDVCTKDWLLVPRYFAVALVAIPVGITKGVAWGFVALAIALSFVATSAYLIGVRKREYEKELVDIERDLRDMRAADAPRA